MKLSWSGLACACAATLVLASGCSPAKEPTAAGGTATTEKTAKPAKIGFVVKQMDDSWFQQETKFAKEKAAELGVELVVQEAKTGDQVLSVIDNLATQGCEGLIICSPETQLGSAIKAATERHKMKLMSVDDRLIGTDGQPLAGVPHLGISAFEIGRLVGKTIAEEMKARNWDLAAVAGIAILKEDLETARQRVDGAKEALKEAGFDPAKVYTAPWKGAVDMTAAGDAANIVITQHGDVKKWIVVSSNDDGVVGATRALQNRGIPASDIIGVGINGTTAAAEFRKDQMTGVFASILLSPRRHGAETVEAMAKWIRDGQTPAMEIYTTGTVINRSNFEEELKREGVQ